MSDEPTTSRSPRPRQQRAVIGWREWVTLPEISSIPLKAKIDTGARTSALHAFGLHIVDEGHGPLAAFELHPTQRSAADAVQVVLPVCSFRRVRSSNGRTEQRPVVETVVRLGVHSWPIEITLTSRDAMGFRMLLGRAAVRRRFLVDPGRSYLIGPKAPGEAQDS